ncbi:MAG TPA: YceD family protein [Ramlibacter sp.]|nr:YceD family protein [Ramlibacter sp.]
MKRLFSPERLDVRAFAEDGAQLAGHPPLAGFHRLVAEAQGEAGERQVEWSARGELLNPQHVHPQVWLHLQARAALPMTCQRCLEPVEIALDVKRSFRFVADEATAAAEDDQSEEDLLAISHSFDLLELVEDELLMELPVVPRHAVCPIPVRMSDADEEEGDDEGETQRPFAGLEGLLKGRKH